MPKVAASATYGCRHDLKIYSSDEGRVQMTAAAFARGFLDLEGFLTPILASLVSKDKARHMHMHVDRLQPPYAVCV